MDAISQGVAERTADARPPRQARVRGEPRNGQREHHRGAIRPRGRVLSVINFHREEVAEERHERRQSFPVRAGQRKLARDDGATEAAPSLPRLTMGHRGRSAAVVQILILHRPPQPSMAYIPESQF